MGVQRELANAWAAGIVDGEGCVTIKKNRQKSKAYFYLALIVGQSGEALPKMLERLQGLYGGNLNRPRISPHTKPAPRRPKWYWQVVCQNAEQVLREILPYMVEKKDQAELALEYRKKGVGTGKGDIAKRYYDLLRDKKHYHKSHPKWSEPDIPGS